MAHLAERIPDEGDMLEAIRAMRAADLYLACACARGETEALASFEKQYFVEVENVHAPAFGARRWTELRQRPCAEKLFNRASRRQAGHPRLRGQRRDLRHWVRVVAVRTGARHGRRRNDAPAGVDVLMGMVDAAGDPEVDYMKQMYRSEFEAALTETWGTLSFRQQNVLRYALGDGLDASKIAVLYRVHRTTVARWLAEATEALLLAQVRIAMQGRDSASRRASSRASSGSSAVKSRIPRAAFERQ